MCMHASLSLRNVAGMRCREERYLVDDGSFVRVFEVVSLREEKGWWA
jgi:hypothetical protein